MRYDKIQFLYNCYLTLFVNNDRIVGDAGDALRGPPYPGKEPNPRRKRAIFVERSLPWLTLSEETVLAAGGKPSRQSKMKRNVHDLCVSTRGGLDTTTSSAALLIFLSCLPNKGKYSPKAVGYLLALDNDPKYRARHRHEAYFVIKDKEV